MMDEQEFKALFRSVDRAGAWPAQPSRGALNFLTADAVLGGLRTVTEGRIISCADRTAAAGVLAAGADGAAALTTSVDASENWLAVNEEVRYPQHGITAMTHLDALGHFFFRGRGYGNTTTGVITEHGVTANDVLPAAGGIAGRGLLLDLPQVIGEPFLPADQTISVAQLTNWLSATGTVPRSGDILFIRTGRPRVASPAPGELPAVGTLDLDCARWLHDERFSLVLTDAGLDAPIPLARNVGMPWHILTLVAMGLFLVDCADLEDLSAACTAAGRHEFLAVLAALPLPGATASPINPLAVL